MRYKIKFELPDNETVLQNIKTEYVNWSVWGYSGMAKVQPVESKWIPVSERLPDKEDVYLCCSTSQDIWILRYMMPYYFKEGAFIQFDGDYPEEFNDVIAWMPLPEPYQGENDD